jgi:hypothetical protein
MLAKGIQQLLDYDGDDVEDVFCLTFQVRHRPPTTFNVRKMHARRLTVRDANLANDQTEHDMFGERVVYDLKPGGEDIPVTNANRKGTAPYTSASTTRDSVIDDINGGAPLQSTLTCM